MRPQIDVYNWFVGSVLVANLNVPTGRVSRILEPVEARFWVRVISISVLFIYMYRVGTARSDDNGFVTTLQDLHNLVCVLIFFSQLNRKQT